MAVNAILPQLDASAIFAGARTALEFALNFSQEQNLPLRLVALTGHLTKARRNSLRTFIVQEFGALSTVVKSILSASELPGRDFGQNDIWIATHWTTAHSLDVASRLGVIDARSVVYLVQDYEPGFTPWSTSFALAQATYHAGFRMVVNSTPLRDYLLASEGLRIPDELVFRPRLDLGRLERAAELRRTRRGDTTSVLFYARPDKPRNLYSIGMSALALTALRDRNSGMRLDVRSAGGLHRKPNRGPLRTMEVLGRLTWPAYFEALARADVLLSLQHSPHPSHPPLDAIVSGGLAVTNELGGTRSGLHPRLLTGVPDPWDLSDSLQIAIARARDGDHEYPFSTDILLGMGKDMSEVMSNVANVR